jgi:alginate O-acetyltransferase complex protein AlgI
VFTPMTFASRRRPGLAPLWLVAAMAVCGLWHGAKWTFVLWGVWHGLLLALNQTVLKRFFSPPPPAAREPALRALLRTSTTFVLVTLGWAFFRAASFDEARRLLGAVFSAKGGLHAAILPGRAIQLVAAVFLILVLAQAAHRLRERHGEWFQSMDSRVRTLKPLLYAVLYFAVAFYLPSGAKPFIYFQF